MMAIEKNRVLRLFNRSINLAAHYVCHKKIAPVSCKENFWVGRMEEDFQNIPAVEGDTYYKKLYEYILKRLQSFNGNRYLELGCYFGYRLNKFAQMMPDKKFIGLEPAAECLKFGKDKIITMPNINLINANAANIPLGDNAVDVVYTVVCLSHIDHSLIGKVTDEIARVGSERVFLTEINDRPMKFRKKIELINSEYIYLHNYEKIFSPAKMKLRSVTPLYDNDNHPRYTSFEFNKISP